MTLDGATLSAFFGGIALLVTAIGTLIANMRKVDPENVKSLQTRLESAEKRADSKDDEVERWRDKLLLANARIFNLESLLTRHGIPVPNEDEIPDGART